MTSRGNPRPNSPAQGQSRHKSQAPGFVRQWVSTGIRPARGGCRLRPSRTPHEVAPIQPQVNRHERDGPRRRLIPGVRRHHGGPRQGTGGGGRDADEDRPPKHREARPQSIDERHCAASSSAYRGCLKRQMRGGRRGDMIDPRRLARRLRSRVDRSSAQSVSTSLSSTASASSSTSQSGSMNLDTCMIVLAGRIAPKYSPWTDATASQSSIRVSSVRVRIT
jgi:hypothetical protein